MARFEVVPSALGTEARRIATHAPTVTQVNGALGAAGLAAAGAAGDSRASAGLGALGARLAGTLTELEASIAGLATATHAAGRRYENTDEGQMR